MLRGYAHVSRGEAHSTMGSTMNPTWPAFLSCLTGIGAARVDQTLVWWFAIRARVAVWLGAECSATPTVVAEAHFTISAVGCNAGIARIYETIC